MRILSLLFVFSALALARNPSSKASEYILKDLPKWSQDGLYDGKFLDIEKLRKDFSFSRFEAVELQNNFKDCWYRGEHPVAQKCFEVAIKLVKEKKFESNWKPVEFKSPAEFVVVLDLDETMLQQWYGSGTQGFFDFKITPDDAGPTRKSLPFIKLTPGAEAFLRKIHSSPLCRAIAVFSAKNDPQALEIYKEWKLSDGQPLSTLISGIFTRHHLTVGGTVTVPSKDLRIFDESLEHVVLVDDNPARVFQPFNLKGEPPFDADRYFEAKKTENSEVREFYETLLPLVSDEILEAAKYAEENSTMFSTAYFPYSYGGNRILRAFIKQRGSEKKGLEAARKHHSLREVTPVKK